MRHISTIVEVLANGDHLTDVEVAAGIAHFNTLADALIVAGPRFTLASDEAIRIAHQLTSIQYTRRR